MVSVRAPKPPNLDKDTTRMTTDCMWSVMQLVTNVLDYTLHKQRVHAVVSKMEFYLIFTTTCHSLNSFKCAWQTFLWNIIVYLCKFTIFGEPWEILLSFKMKACTHIQDL